MKDIEYAMHVVCNRNREGSYSTIANRDDSLRLIGRQLESLGYRQIKRAEQLKPKHIWAVVTQWKDEGLAEGTIKNRMSHLRWLAAKIGKNGLIAKDNDHYGIGKRTYVTGENKSLHFDQNRIDKIDSKYVRLAAELQREFGLRREEAMKFNASKADQHDKIVLQGSWCKGGKERVIPIRNAEQRKLLDRVHEFCGKRSLIPPEKTYVQHMNTYMNSMSKVGLGRTHGARHMYAQRRYIELAGRLPPALGGMSRRKMTKEDRIEDEKIRLEISRELGHERMQIVAVYIGS